jgi:hypothetical protein
MFLLPNEKESIMSLVNYVINADDDDYEEDQAEKLLFLIGFDEEDINFYGVDEDELDDAYEIVRELPFWQKQVVMAILIDIALTGDSNLDYYELKALNIISRECDMPILDNDDYNDIIKDVLSGYRLD